MPIRLAIHGAAGRMGRRLIALSAADPQFQLVAALESPQHVQLGEDVGTVVGLGPLGIALSADLTTEADCMIDFSVPDAIDRVLETCLPGPVALVYATTGLDDSRKARLTAAAGQIPILSAPSMSLAVNLTMKLASLAGSALADKDADVEILERHHRFKEDAPSGTALRFGQLITEGMGQTTHRHGRQGRPGQRTHGEIGFHAIRVGDNPGEHTIIFGMLGETIELTVRATNRDCYALGALSAAKFLADKPPAMYGMEDVLGL